MRNSGDAAATILVSANGAWNLWTDKANLSLDPNSRAERDPTQKLDPILGEDDVTARLIMNLSIKLDNFGRIPEYDVTALEQKLRANITAYTILRLLVADYLYYLFPVTMRLNKKWSSFFRIHPAHWKTSLQKRTKRRLPRDVKMCVLPRSSARLLQGCTSAQLKYLSLFLPRRSRF